MSGSLTVIGGHTGSPLSGLVNIPMDQTPLTLTGIQSLLDVAGGAVSTNTASFINLNVISATVADSVLAGSGGIYELTNTDSTGAVTSGTVSGSYTVPAGFTTLVVEAPGDETVTGTAQTGFLAVFSAQSSVNFTADGTGTVVASDNNFIQVGGTFGPTTGWSVIGGSGGADTINTTAESTSITTQGAGNVVGLAGIFATVVAGGTGDLIAGYGGENVVSVTGAGTNMLISGGTDTVYATSGSSGLNMFFFGTSGGGSLNFINQSSVSASITGGSDGSSGHVTAFGGTGGGYYEGGTSGNNSLVGGVGTSASTVIGAGNTNFLSVGGSGPNDLVAGDGTATLIAGSGTTTNIFSGGLGTDIISTSGSGDQSFFAGTTGSETLTGSSVAGALNTYYFNQTSAQGGGTDVITDFRYGTDKVYINPFDTTGGAVSVQGISTIDINGQSSSAIQLTDNTTIKLVGVTFTSAQSASIVGSTHF